MCIDIYKKYLNAEFAKNLVLIKKTKHLRSVCL